MKRSEPTEAQIEAVSRRLVDRMRAQLAQHGMDTSDAAVREACRRQLRARVALQALCEQSGAV